MVAEQFFHLPSPLSRDELVRGLDRPDFRDRQRILVACDAGRAVARLVARLSPTLVDGAGAPLGLISYFEARRRPAAVRTLVEDALDWLRARGARTVLGPMDGDTWHRYRWNLGPFEVPAFPGEPTNPPFYPELFEEAGFREISGYHSARVENLLEALPALRTNANRAAADGYRLLPLGRGQLRLLHDLARVVFRRNDHYSDIGFEEFGALYRGAEVAGGYSWIAYAPDGEPAGFVFAYADRRAVNIKSIGVHPAHLRRGVATLLAVRAYDNALCHGRRAANLCLMRDGNPSRAVGGGLAEPFRRYALYERSVA